MSMLKTPLHCTVPWACMVSERIPTAVISVHFHVVSPSPAYTGFRCLILWGPASGRQSHSLVKSGRFSAPALPAVLPGRLQQPTGRPAPRSFSPGFTSVSAAVSRSLLCSDALPRHRPFSCPTRFSSIHLAAPTCRRT